MELIRETPNIGIRVKGTLLFSSYTGKIIFITKEGTRLHILRDDGQQGGGKEYKGKPLWISDYNKYKKYFCASLLRNGKLYSLKIENWRDRIK